MKRGGEIRLCRRALSGFVATRFWSRFWWIVEERSILSGFVARGFVGVLLPLGFGGLLYRDLLPRGFGVGFDGELRK